VCALLAIAVLGAAGCGVEEHVNDQRRSPSARVSVIVEDKAVSVQPRELGVGPEPSSQLPQNREVEQPRLKRRQIPLDVVMVAANHTENYAKLVVSGPETNVTSEPLVANGNGSLETSLKPGAYTIRAAGIPGAKPAHLLVGSYRVSSENDVLLP
jgi:hypothetical protein